MKVIKFEADWCVPCKQIAPAVKEIVEAAGVELETINVDDFPAKAEKYGVQSLPTVLVLDGSREVLRVVGNFPGWKSKLKEALHA